jgi:hypothetical protein
MTDVDDLDTDDRYWRRRGTTGPLAPKLAPPKTGFYGTRTLGGLHEVTPGCMVWAHDHGDLTKVALDHHGEPRGGIVLDTYPALDQAWLEETGEPVERKHYWCFNPKAWWPRAFSTLTEVQIVADGCEAPDPAAIARACRNISAHLAECHGPIDIDQARKYAAVARLVAVLMGAAA